MSSLHVYSTTKVAIMAKLQLKKIKSQEDRQLLGTLLRIAPV